MPNYPEVDTDSTLHIHREGHTQSNAGSFLAFPPLSLSNLIYVYTLIYSSRDADSSKSAGKYTEKALPKYRWVDICAHIYSGYISTYQWIWACTHTHEGTGTGAARTVYLGYRGSAVIAIIFYSLELCLRRRESADAEASNFGGGGGFPLVFKAGWQSAGLR